MHDLKLGITEQEGITLERFIDQMKIELINNRYKGSIIEWKGINEKLQDLQYHQAKMIIAIRMGDKVAVAEYIADCGNILMSIGHELTIYDYDRFNNRMQSELVGEVFKQFPIGQNKRGNFLENIK